MTDEQLQQYIQELTEDVDQVRDVAHLDRVLISQFVNAPDVKPVHPVEYINQVMTNYFITLKRYDDDTNPE